MRWKLKIAGIFLLILTLLPQVCLAASYKARPNSSPANYSSSNPARLNAVMLYATSAVAVTACPAIPSLTPRLLAIGVNRLAGRNSATIRPNTPRARA